MWSRAEAFSTMCGSIAVAIQRGNMLALDAVQKNNDDAGLVRSRPERVPISVPAHRMADDGDQSSDDSDNDQDHLPADRPQIRTHGSRVIIPRSILRSQAQGVEDDSDDDVVEVDVNSSLRMPEDVSSRSGDGSSFGAARDVQGAAERREVLL